MWSSLEGTGFLWNSLDCRQACRQLQMWWPKKMTCSHGMFLFYELHFGVGSSAVILDSLFLPVVKSCEKHMSWKCGLSHSPLSFVCVSFSHGRVNSWAAPVSWTSGPRVSNFYCQGEEGSNNKHPPEDTGIKRSVSGWVFLQAECFVKSYRQALNWSKTESQGKAKVLTFLNAFLHAEQ